MPVVAIAYFSSMGADVANCTRSTLCSGVNAHYDFDEGRDSIRYSSDGHGTLVEPQGQDVESAGGKFGRSAVFPGSPTSYLYIPNTANFADEVYTLVFWVYPESLGDVGQRQAIISTNSSASRGETLYLENVAGKLQARWLVTNRGGDSVVASSTENLETLRWHMIAASLYSDFNASKQDLMSLSVNGGRFASATLDQPIRSETTQIRLGGQPWVGKEWPFAGRIDHFTSWERFLKGEEIRLLHNAGAGRAFPFETGTR